jgi:CBS domain-containing protein
MQVREVMTQSPEFVTPQTPISEAAQRMRSRDIGSLPVCESFENPRLLGIITDRDVTIRAVADQRDPGTTPVGEIMSTDVHSCQADQNIEACSALMQQWQVRRIPVTDEEGKLVGMVALADLAVRPETSPFAARSLGEISTDRMKQVRDMAFELWQRDGRPEGRDLEYWARAEALAAQERQAAAA